MLKFWFSLLFYFCQVWLQCLRVRFWSHGAHAVCFCALVTILNPDMVCLFWVFEFEGGVISCSSDSCFGYIYDVSLPNKLYEDSRVLVSHEMFPLFLTFVVIAPTRVIFWAIRANLLQPFPHFFILLGGLFFRNPLLCKENCFCVTGLSLSTVFNVLLFSLNLVMLRWQAIWGISQFCYDS
jgi:hypothetical protein